MPTRWRCAAVMVMSFAATCPRTASAQSAERIRVANALLDAMEFDRVYLGAVTGVVPVRSDSIVPAASDSIRANPVVAFYRRYAPPSVVRPQMARAYALIFSVDELQELVVFFSRPAGKKFARHHHEFDRQVQGIVLAEGSKHPAEFVKAMRQATPPEPSAKRPD